MGHLHGRLIAFDLDGTLVDSRRDLAESANELIEELGGTPLPEEAIGCMVGEGAAILVSRALQASGLGHRVGFAASNDPAVASGFPGRQSRDGGEGGSRKALARFLEIYDARLLRHTVLYPGITQAVEAARRHARVAVLTNKPARATECILEGLGVRPLFDDMVSGDGPWPRKPNPASLLALMARAGAPPVQTLLVGDSRIDLETARAAGTRVCLARYGYGYAETQVGALRDDEALVDAPAHLAHLFARLFPSPR